MSATADDETSETRLETEISLLQAMYPDQIVWNQDHKSRELRYTSNTHDESVSSSARSDGKGRAQLNLRLPDSYPEQGLPSLISATDGVGKRDLRQDMQEQIRGLQLSDGVEVLDAIVSSFEELLLILQERQRQRQEQKGSGLRSADGEGWNKTKTVVIWLHHLLATGKRKLALNPTLTASTSTPTTTTSSMERKDKGGKGLTGVTKPGYPGIMVFSGPVELVDAHVAELKAQRWQAFQVRLEETYDTEQSEKKDGGGEWKFEHGQGIAEVESMADVARCILGERNRETFLRSVGVK